MAVSICYFGLATINFPVPCIAANTSGADHSPADILRWLLITLGALADPASGGDWPGYCSMEPNTPDNCVTTFDVAGKDHGRVATDGSRDKYFGVQVRVRATNHLIGWPKAESLRLTIDTSILQNSLQIGDSTYCVHSVTASDVIELGKELGVTKRHLFVVNCLVDVKKIS